MPYLVCSIVEPFEKRKRIAGYTGEEAASEEELS